MKQLDDRAKKFVSHLPSIAAKKIDTQYSVIRNQYSQLENFQTKLLRDCQELKQREKIYLEYFHDLTQSIAHVQTILKSPINPTESSILKELEYLLQSKRDVIERLNSNEFLLYIKRTKQLDQLFGEYSQCIQAIKTRLEQIQLDEEKKFNFQQRCQKWNEYLQAIEQNLAVIEENSHTNYQGLIAIETNLANTMQDLNQRQVQFMQLLNEQKHVQLEQRWQNLANRVRKKQEEVKDLIQLWLSYQNQLESKDSPPGYLTHMHSLSLGIGYHRLLKGKCHIEQQELQTATISLMQQIQQGTYTSSVGNEELRSLLEKLYQMNRRLIRHSDTKTQLTLEKEWTDLQKSVDEIESNIKQRYEALRTVSLVDHLMFDRPSFQSRKTSRKEKVISRQSLQQHG